MVTLIPLVASLLTKPKFSGGAVIGTAMIASLMCCRLADPVMAMVARFINQVG